MGGPNWQYFDWLLFLIAVILTVTGIAMIYSATRGSVILADTWRKQAIYAVVGVVLLFMTALINYHILESLQWPLYLLALGVLAFTLVFGSSDIGDVRRFIYIGGTSIQPAFPTLMLLIITQASILARNAPNPPGIQEFILSLGMTGIAAFLVFKQPNLSTATLYIASWGAIVFASGINLTYLGGLSVVGLASLPIVWLNLNTYMKNRIHNFLDPSRDPAAQYNIKQALISIGSGGAWGKGFATGTQSQLHFLRVRHTDFIFSVVCEELGFIGATLLLLLFALLLWRLLRIAGNAPDRTGQLIVVGVTAYIFYQLVINLGMNLNLIPVAGLPMPFISSGGSALVITYLGLGLVEGIIMQQKRLEF